MLDRHNKIFVNGMLCLAYWSWTAGVAFSTTSIGRQANMWGVFGAFMAMCLFFAGAWFFAKFTYEISEYFNPTEHEPEDDERSDGA